MITQLLKDVSQSDHPTFSVSAKTEEAYDRARKEEIEGKLKKVDDLEAFF